MEVSRRGFVKIVGAGAAVAGMGSMLPVRAAGAATVARPAAAPLSKAMEENISWRLQVLDSTDPLAAETVQIAPNMEPVILHEDQAAEAQKKLAALLKKTGKKPNILIFIMDNVGWGDLGINGGGLMVGAPTPNIDQLGRDGLNIDQTSFLIADEGLPNMAGEPALRHGASLLHCALDSPQRHTFRNTPTWTV